MKDKVTIDGVEITREQYEQLHKAFNEPDPPTVGRWKPEYDEKYYSVDTNGDVIGERSDDDSIDLARYRYGNIYRTEKEAQKAADRKRAKIRLKDWAAANGAFEPKEGEERWVVGVDGSGGLVTDSWHHIRHPDEICFRTKEDAIRFLEECRDDLNIFWDID